VHIAEEDQEAAIKIIKLEKGMNNIKLGLVEAKEEEETVVTSTQTEKTKTAKFKAEKEVVEENLMKIEEIEEKNNKNKFQVIRKKDLLKTKLILWTNK
jgi:hypothetical protein